MHKFLLQVFAVCLMTAPIGIAAAEQQHNHDPALVGSWSATTVDGSLASLSFESGGKFILDQRSATTLERQYMCGTWERNGNAVELAVKAQKDRLADGQIEQAIAESRGEFRVLRATRNTLVLRIDSMVLSFYRIT